MDKNVKKFTLKDFVTELNARLGKFTHQELKEIILEHGKTLSSRERKGYLDIFNQPQKQKK